MQKASAPKKRKKNMCENQLAVCNVVYVSIIMINACIRAKEYWSGYYTSRPFTKHMSRVLESTLRSAEILLSLSIAHHRYLPHHATLLGDMVRARRELALFQHHDGMTCPIVSMTV